MPPIDPIILTDNAAQRQRLASLAARLSDADLQKLVHGRWTVAVAFAHLAFWDRLYLQHLRSWQKEGPPSNDPGESLNDVLLDEWLAVAPRRAGELALAAARAVDAAVETLQERTADAIITHGSDWLLKRGRHRREHLDQIERAVRR